LSNLLESIHKYHTQHVLLSTIMWTEKRDSYIYLFDPFQWPIQLQIRIFSLKSCLYMKHIHFQACNCKCWASFHRHVTRDKQKRPYNANFKFIRTWLTYG
jgi:hypothetical protein